MYSSICSRISLTYKLSFQSNQIWIVIFLFPFIWHQTDFRLVPNQLEKENYNPNLVWIVNTTELDLIY